ncbi:glycosyltransferase, partial [Kitasatospora sp. NPDC018623]|uniref:glycosyltransferase n=1 Tax=Kitasatospora sp. NPDC018623 TaxID=3364029 RepID=UPI0037AFE673
PETEAIEDVEPARTGVDRVRMLAPEDVPTPTGQPAGQVQAGSAPGATTGLLQVPTQAAEDGSPLVGTVGQELSELDQAREQLIANGVGEQEQAGLRAGLDALREALDASGASVEDGQGLGTALQMGLFQQAFAALNHDRRVEVLRLLAQALRDGLHVGQQSMMTLLVTSLDAAQRIRHEMPRAAVGQSPRALAEELTRFADTVLAGAVSWARESMRDVPTAPYAVVAVGGYGRTDLTPAADLDFGLLGASEDSARLRSLINLAAGWLDLARAFLPVNPSATAPFQADTMWFNPNLAIFEPLAVLKSTLAASADDLTPKHGVAYDARLIELRPIPGALATVTSQESQRDLFGTFTQARSVSGVTDVEWAALEDALAVLLPPARLAELEKVNVKEAFMRQLTVATRHLYAAWRAELRTDAPWRLSTGGRLEELIAANVLPERLGRSLMDAYVLGLGLRQRLHRAYGGERDEVATTWVASPPAGMERLLPAEQEQLAAALGALHEWARSLGALRPRLRPTVAQRFKSFFGSSRPVADQSGGSVSQPGAPVAAGAAASGASAVPWAGDPLPPLPLEVPTVPGVSVAEQVALLVAGPAVTALPRGASLVLVGAGLGAGSPELPRAVADATGRTVYAYTGLVRSGPDGLETEDGGGGLPGYWVVHRPAAPGSVEPTELWDPDLELPVVGGGSVRLGDVQSLTVVAPGTGLPQGRAFHTGNELAQRRQVLSSFDLGRPGLLHVDGQGREVTGYQNVPWNTGGRRYLALLHGDRDHAVLPLPGPAATAKVTATGLARTLRRRPSVQRLAAGDEIVLAACEAALPASDGGPSLAQVTANETGRAVWAPTGKIAALPTELDAEAGFLMYPAADGSPGTWVRFTPDGVQPVAVPDVLRPVGASGAGPAHAQAPLAPTQSSTGPAMTELEESDVEESEDEEVAGRPREDKGKGRAVEEERSELADDLDAPEGLEDLEARNVARAIELSRRSQRPETQGEGSGTSARPAAVSPTEQQVPFTAQELIDELMGELPAPRVSAEPVGELEEWLGPDLFGDRVVPAAPAFLRGYDYRELHSASRAAFFRALDLASETEPTAERFTPASLGADETSVVEAGLNVSLSGTMRRKSRSLFPKLVRIPRLVHSIWLGRPLSADDEHTGPFMANVEASAGGPGQGFTHVVWTDVTRERIREAKEAEGTGQDTEELATVREMVAWARDHKIVLVNVDEVFSAEAPMVLEAAYKMETAKGVGQGYASASDILRLEILQRFGGIYTDGDNELLVDPTDAVQRIADSGQGFAVAVVGHGGMANAVLIAPARHEAVQRHLEVLRGNYLRSSWENSIRGGYFRLLDKNVYSTTDFRKADKEATKPPAVVQNHTDEGDKNAVLHLSGTGPAIWADLARGLGLDSPRDLPRVDPNVFRIGVGNTWVPREQPTTAAADAR